MGARITQGQREMFYRFLGEGHNVKAAAINANVSYSWAKNNLANLPSKGAALKEAKKAASLHGPIPTAKLKPEARRALDDFEYFRRRYFGHVSQPWHIEAAKSVVDLLSSPHKEYVVMNEPPGCLAGSTEIVVNRGGNSRRMTIADLVHKFNGGTNGRQGEKRWDTTIPTRVQTAKSGGRVAGAFLRLGTVADAYESGVQTTYALTTSGGRTIRATADHPFMVTGGAFVRLGDLKPGDLVMVDGGKSTTGKSVKPLYRTTEGLVNHPNCRAPRYRQPAHRLVVEAELNQLPLDWFVALLRDRFCDTSSLKFLDPTVHVHHRDENTLNNTLDNLEVLDVVQHLGHHGSTSTWANAADRVTVDRVESIVEYGDEMTYDLTMADEPHNFVANEFVVHNSGKTTIVHDIICWVIVKRRAIRVLMGSATSKKAETMQKRVRRSLERVTPTRASAEDKERGLACDSEATLCVDFGLFKPATGGDLWRADSFIVLQHGDEMIDEKEPTCSAYGMDQDFLGGRYDLIFWDDLVTMKHVKTMEQVEQQREWWDREAESRLEPGGALFLVGQRVASNDLYRHCLDKKLLPEDDDDFEQAAAALTAGEDEKVADLPTKYTHVVYRAHDEIRCQGEHKVDAPAWPDGCLLDPRRLTWRELRAIRANDAAVYATWYQQEDADPKQTLVRSVWVTGGTDPETGTYHPGCWDKDRDLWEIPKGLVGPKYFFGTVDPSPSKMWAIQAWCYAPEAGHQLFLLDTIRRSMGGNELLDWNNNTQSWYGVMEEWQTRSVQADMKFVAWVVEVNAAQRFLLQFDHVRRWIGARQVDIRPHTTTVRKNDADLGVDMCRDWWKFGRIRLPGKATTQARTASLKLVEEVQKYPNAYTDDQVMAHYFAILHLPEISSGWEIKEPPKFARPTWMQNTDRGFVRV